MSLILRCRGRSSRLICYYILSLVIVSTATVFASGIDRYFDGDWIGYTSQRYVTSVAVDPEYVYFGTRGGIMRFDRFRDIWEESLTTIDGLPSNLIVALAYDRETSELYARTIEGDAVYNSVYQEFESTSHFPESLVTHWSDIELLEYNLPFGYSAVEENFITDTYLRDFMVRGAITDDWGNVWVGTWGLGVWRGSDHDIDLVHLPHGLAHSNVRTIERLGEHWWFAGPRLEGKPTGVTVFDTLTQSWRYFEARFTHDFNSDDILDLALTADTMWMATAAGLSRYAPNENHPFKTYNEFSGLFSDQVTAVEPDEDLLWIGTDRGVNLLHIPQDSLVRATDRLTHGVYVYDLEVVDDFVWMGTDRGLFRLFKKNYQWRRFSAAEGILNGRVRSIAVDDTAFYFGTDFGLAMVLRDGSGVKEYSAGDIFPSSDIYALAVTERIVWASTPYGLVRFDPRTEEYRLFTKTDGLFDDFVQVIYPDGDYLWLGTQEGVQRFYWKNPYRID